MTRGGTQSYLSPMQARRARLIQFYDAYTSEHGSPPGAKVICRSVPGIKSPNAAHCAVTRLRKKKLIQSRRPR
jgi:hypothetical protein